MTAPTPAHVVEALAIQDELTPALEMMVECNAGHYRQHVGSRRRGAALVLRFVQDRAEGRIERRSEGRAHPPWTPLHDAVARARLAAQAQPLLRARAAVLKACGLKEPLLAARSVD